MMDDNTTDSSSPLDPELMKVLQRFHEALANGQGVDIDEVVAKHPSHEQAIREFAATMLAIRRLDETSGYAPCGDRESSGRIAVQAEQSLAGLQHAQDIPEPPQQQTGSSLRMIGEFSIVREIGRGGMGVVYEAFQPSLGRRVALKLLPYAALADPRALRRFQNEARAAATLHHANIVPVFSVGSDKAIHFFSMQFIEGPSLAEVIQTLRQPNVPALDQSDSRADEAAGNDETHRDLQAGITTLRENTRHEFFRRTAEWIAQAADGLAYAHEHGVLHRDIKPGNLLLDENGTVWITDFGLARLEADASMTATGDILGTLRYMAPEQAGGKGELIDQRADIFALGLTLYELLTLQPGYAGDSREELLRKVTQYEVSSVRKLDGTIPLDLETIVLKATAREPSDRYRTAAEFAEDLRAFLNNRAIQARRPSLASRAWKWTLRNRSATIAVGIAILVTMLSLLTTTVLTGAALGRAKQAETAALSDRDRAIASKYVADVRLAQREWEDANLDPVYSFLKRYEAGAVPLELRGWEYWWVKGLTDSAMATLKGHEDTVTSLAWSPNGQFLASGSVDQDIHIWNAMNHCLHATFDGHKIRVESLDWSPDGKQLATSHYDSHVKTWDAATGNKLNQMVGHIDVCWSVSWSPDGKQLISTGNYKNKAIRIWNPATAEQVRYIPDAHRHSINASAFSSDGKFLATGSMDQTVAIWNTSDWSKKVTIDAHRGNARRVDWSPTNKYLASIGEDGTAKVWDVNGNLVNVLRGHNGMVMDTRWNPTGDVLATAAGDHTVKLWEPLDSQEYISWPSSRLYAWNALGDGIAVTSRIRKGKGSREFLKFYDLQSNAVQTFEVETPGNANIVDMDWSQDESMMALHFEHDQESAGIRVVNASNFETIHELPVASDSAMCVSFSPDGSYLAVGGISNEAAPCYVWRMDDGTLEAELDLGASIESAVWSPDGKKLAVASWTQDVHVFRVGKWRTLLKLDRHPNANVSNFGGEQMVSWSPDSSRLYAGSVLGWIVGWDAETGTELSRFKAHSGGIRSIDINADGTRLATCGNDRAVKVWDLFGNLYLTLSNPARLHTVTWSPDGRKLAARSNGVRVWTAANAK